MTAAPAAPLPGVAFVEGDIDSAADLVIERARGGEGGFACLCNVHVLVTARRDESVRAALRDAWVVFPDGAPVAWLQRRLGARGAQRIAGPDLMPLVIDRGRGVGLRHFLYGSTQSVLNSLERSLARRYPGAEFVGTYAPPFGKAIDEANLDAVVSAEPDVVWCALGAPKQELWMSRNAGALRPALLVGVGAAFDFNAGTKTRAPEWMQSTGLEWLHRLGGEPARLAPRYLTTNYAFVVTAAKALLKERL